MAGVMNVASSGLFTVNLPGEFRNYSQISDENINLSESNIY